MFTEEQKKENRERIIAALTMSKRPGIEKLIEHMDKIDFFNAPCSTQYHLCCDGGLAAHSLNVADTIVDLAQKLCKPSERPEFETLYLIALLHDLGKCGRVGKPLYVENILKTGKRSESKPFVTNSELLNVPHEIRSIAIAESFIELTEDEEYAILMHNGMYSDLKYQFNGHETPLALLLHFADVWSSRVTEKEGGENNDE